MTTIDNLDITTHFQYARRVASVEMTNELFQLEEAHSIPAQTTIVNLYPNYQEIERLFGFRHSSQPWAAFVIPEEFTEQRRSSFAFDRICPSLGSQERQEADMQKLQGLSFDEDQEGQDSHGDDGKEGEEEEIDVAILSKKKREREVLHDCLVQIRRLNGWINFVRARIGQMLQG